MHPPQQFSLHFRADGRVEISPSVSRSVLPDATLKVGVEAEIELRRGAAWAVVIEGVSTFMHSDDAVPPRLAQRDRDLMAVLDVGMYVNDHPSILPTGPHPQTSRR